MYYVYRQNNSFGFFKGPAINVVIEAESCAEADNIAEQYIYFNGVASDIDCSCCGDRWYSQWADDDGYFDVADAIESCVGSWSDSAWPDIIIYEKHCKEPRIIEHMESKW